ncbi:MAG: hypothetical protein WC175_01125 [Candidatus Dojkabacteria bacterium]
MLPTNKLNFDSSYEEEVYEWLQEASSIGLIKDVSYKPCTYSLYEKVEYEHLKIMKKKEDRIEHRVMLKPMTYTPDFSFFIRKDFLCSLKHLLLSSKGKHSSMLNDEWIKIIIDVKSFSGNRFNNNSSAVSFPIKQKVLFHNKGIFVNKLIPDTLFKATWGPDSVINKLNGKRRNSRRIKKMISFADFKQNN